MYVGCYGLCQEKFYAKTHLTFPTQVHLSTDAFSTLTSSMKTRFMWGNNHHAPNYTPNGDIHEHYKCNVPCLNSKVS